MKRVFTQGFSVVGAIIEKDGKFLLVQENMPSRPDHLKWNQPAGWLDVGEDPLEGVTREIKEETGLNFTPTAIIGIYSLVRKDLSNDSGTPHAIKLIFKGNISGTPHTNTPEIKTVKWFTQSEIMKMDQSQLRDSDIKNEIQDYLDGKSIPLEFLHHTTMS